MVVASSAKVGNPGRDDKGRGVAQVGVVAGWEENSRSRDYASRERFEKAAGRTADPSLRSG